MTSDERFERRMAKYQVAHEKRMAAWDKRMTDFAATMHGYQIRAESDMLTIREEMTRLTTSQRETNRMLQTLIKALGRSGNGKHDGKA